MYSTVFMIGHKPGMDYDALAAEVTQIRAERGSSNKQFVTMSTSVVAPLISEQHNANNHMSRLVITQAERLESLHHLRRGLIVIRSENRKLCCEVMSDFDSIGN
jgi:hypothetical protein